MNSKRSTKEDKKKAVAGKSSSEPTVKVLVATTDKFKFPGAFDNSFTPQPSRESALRRDSISGQLGSKKIAIKVVAKREQKAVKYSQQIRDYLLEDTLYSNAKLYELANAGVPISVLDQFKETLSMMVTSKVLPRKTLEDAKKNPNGKLSARNSEKLIRVLRLKHNAQEALGKQSAMRWMEKSNKNFNGLTAIEMAKSESGARAVEQFLGQLAHGFNA